MRADLQQHYLEFCCVGERSTDQQGGERESGSKVNHLSLAVILGEVVKVEVEAEERGKEEVMKVCDPQVCTGDFFFFWPLVLKDLG